MSPAPRTSHTHPLRIDPVACAAGEVGITFCPGKCGDSVHGAPWLRDLGTDLDAIRHWGATAVVTLVEDHELASLGVTALGAEVVSRGMQWHHLPIPDVQVPGDDFHRAWPEAAEAVAQRLERGERILVHCRGGLGRAGMVAACLLIHMGESPAQAIRKVRAARPGAIETEAQHRYVLSYRPPRTPKRVGDGLV